MPNIMHDVGFICAYFKLMCTIVYNNYIKSVAMFNHRANTTK